MYKLTIFDMDGTTLYTLIDLKDMINHALEKNGFPTNTLEQVRCYVGNGIHKLVERSLPDTVKDTVIEKVYEDCLEYYQVHCNDHTAPYEGMLDLLHGLRKKGIHTAIVSNKADSAVQILDEIYFKDCIEFGIGEKQGVRRKPAPDSVNHVLEYFDVKKEEAVYIGDSEVDVQTAKNAGMDCIAVSYGYRSKEELIASGATTIVDTVEELKEILNK